jgi:hypothetical protein
MANAQVIITNGSEYAFEHEGTIEAILNTIHESGYLIVTMPDGSEVALNTNHIESVHMNG